MERSQLSVLYAQVRALEAALARQRELSAATRAELAAREAGLRAEPLDPRERAELTGELLSATAAVATAEEHIERSEALLAEALKLLAQRLAEPG